MAHVNENAIQIGLLLHCDFAGQALRGEVDVRYRGIRLLRFRLSPADLEGHVSAVAEVAVRRAKEAVIAKANERDT